MDQFKDFGTFEYFQNLASKELLLDTKGACFLCLKEIASGSNHDGKRSSASSECHDDNDTGQNEVSFRNICRYLKINPSEILVKTMRGNSLNEEELYEVQREKCDFSVMLCPTCSIQTRKLTSLICQLERLKMVVSHEFQVFHQILEGLEGVAAEVSNWNRVQANMVQKGADTVEVRLVKGLRQLTKQKGSAKMMNLRATNLPRVLVEPLSKDILNIQYSLQGIRSSRPNKETPAAKAQGRPMVWKCDPADLGCGKVCASSDSLWRHKQRYCPAKPANSQKKMNLKFGRSRFICSRETGGCGKTFTRKYDLETHKQYNCATRGKRQVWKCSVADGGCGRVCSKKSNLLRHIEVHCPARRYKAKFNCSWEKGGCGKSFKTGESLERHQQHNCPAVSESTWACGIGGCKSKLVSEYALVQHQKYKCQFRRNVMGVKQEIGGDRASKLVPEEEESLVDPLEITSGGNPEETPGSLETPEENVYWMNSCVGGGGPIVKSMPSEEIHVEPEPDEVLNDTGYVPEIDLG